MRRVDPITLGPKRQPAKWSQEASRDLQRVVLEHFRRHRREAQAAPGGRCKRRPEGGASGARTEAQAAGARREAQAAPGGRPKQSPRDSQSPRVSDFVGFLSDFVGFLLEFVGFLLEFVAFFFDFHATYGLNRCQS